MGGLQDPPKVDFLNLTPLTLLQNSILAHFVAKSGPHGRIRGYVAPPHPLATGLPTNEENMVVLLQLGLDYISTH